MNGNVLDFASPKSMLTEIDQILSGRDEALLSTISGALTNDSRPSDKSHRAMSEMVLLQKRNFEMTLAARAISKAVSAVDQLTKMN
ncbi:hypothetical protein WT37_04340 [Burkholderia territorii]|nr:hypothetical protein WT37_04340 [Burkholderia territorii]